MIKYILSHRNHSDFKVGNWFVIMNLAVLFGCKHLPKSGETRIKYFDNSKSIEIKDSFLSESKFVRFEYYANGKLFDRCEYKNNLQDGLYESYYPKGERMARAVMVKGLKNGSFIVYSDTGSIITDVVYKNDTLVSK